MWKIKTGRKQERNRKTRHKERINRKYGNKKFLSAYTSSNTPVFAL
jgi:hypothetical protein